MSAIEVITGRVVNPGATVTALTANTSSSFTIRDFPEVQRAFLAGIWAQGATAGVVRVHSARFHDDVQGIRFRNPAANIRNYLTDYGQQPLYPNDPLRFEMSGGGAETDSASLLVYYRELPGVNARLTTWDQIKSRVANLLTVEVPVVGPVTAGDWSAGTVITTLTDLLKADTTYAVLGYQTDTNCNAVALAGTDTGNLKIGGPGPTESVETRDWFVSLDRALAEPCIPLINANNRGSTLAHVALNTAAGTINVSFSLAQLS